jgi:hypothetical protein
MEHAQCVELTRSKLNVLENIKQTDANGRIMLCLMLQRLGYKLHCAGLGGMLFELTVRGTFRFY